MSHPASRSERSPWRSRIFWSSVSLTLVILVLGLGLTWPVILEWWELREIQTSVAGLSCDLHAVTRTVDQGDDVEFEVTFEFQDSADAMRGHFDTQESNREFSFTFRSRETGELFRREPRFEYSYPTFTTADDLPELSPGLVAVETLHVPLVTEGGDGLPPGVYRVFAEYESRDSLKGVNSSSDSFGTIWRGKIVSSPTKIVVRPKTPWAETARVPREVIANRDGSRFQWHWRAGDLESIEFERRPGYLLSHQVRYSLVVGENVEPIGMSMGDGELEGWDADWISSDLIEGPIYEEGLERGFVLRVEIELLESTRFGRFSPEGDVRTLWSRRWETEVGEREMRDEAAE